MPPRWLCRRVLLQNSIDVVSDIRQRGVTAELRVLIGVNDGAARPSLLYRRCQCVQDQLAVECRTGGPHDACYTSRPPLGDRGTPEVPRRCPGSP